MTSYQPEQAAAALHEARQRRGQVAPLPAGHRAAHRGGRRGGAARAGASHRRGAPGGFKIGATARRMQEYLGLSGPAAGFMAIGNIHRSGATVRFADYVRPGVECELAVRLARDLPPGPVHRGAGRRCGGRPGRRHRDRREPLWRAAANLACRR